ncbi:MAG TPA: phospholipase D-like domain-containing protein [Thermoanaerobaculia bacterium]|nr:phospholipase D-like domain-containing protein [Thermoanaerobaculia bacterium]
MKFRKRLRLWKPRLRPLSGRKLADELRPDRVGALAVGLSGGVRDPGLVTLLSRVDQAPVLGGNCVDVDFEGAAAFAAMDQAIDGARTEILAESYIWKDDATGRRTLDALGRAAARGVAVRVLADAWGSFSTRRRYWREMRERGIEVRLFNPLFPHLFAQPLRDHRKILVVDRTIAFTGGMNIADEYCVGTAGESGRAWRDTHARVEGPAAWEMTTVFSEAWSAAGGGDLELQPLAPPEEGGARVLVLDSRPGRGHGETASVLAAIVAAARERIWITNAYFAPQRRAIEALAGATRRGVDVRLLLPGLTDVPVVRHAGHGLYDTLRAAGVRIYEYQPAILHAKTMVADDFVSFVGSSNLDFRSFHFNSECNFLVLDEDVGRTMSAAFERDLLSSREIDESWTRTFRHRLGDSLARRLGPLL